MNSKEHFDRIAEDYDHWKRKHSYYYENLKNLYKALIPKDSTVLEIGCGTGDVLASLQLTAGCGVDISEKMIELAKSKHKGQKQLQFQAVDVLTLDKLAYDFILLPDVIEHIGDLDSLFGHLSQAIDRDTRAVVSVANPFWEPYLMLAERLKIKMPEGPHRRLSIKDNEAVFRKAGFLIREKGFRLLIPWRAPGADWINHHFCKSRLLSRFGFVVFWVLQLQGSRRGTSA